MTDAPAKQVSFWRAVGAVARKDLRIEWRNKEMAITLSFFSLVLLVVFSFSFGADSTVVREAVPGTIWTTALFAGTLALGRAFSREQTHGTMRALLLAPVPRAAIFFGKLLSMWLFLVLIETILSALTVLILDVTLPWPRFLLLLFSGTLGFCLVGCVFSGMLLRVRSRDILLPITLYPICLPLFLAATKGTAALLASPVDNGTFQTWIGVTAAFNGIFLVASLWIFESLVIE